MAVALLAAWGVGVSAAAASEVWVTGPSHKVLLNEQPRPAPHLYDPLAGRVRLWAARNEFVSFQVVIRGPARAVAPVCGGLAGQGGARIDGVRMFHEHYLPHEIVSQYEKDNHPPDVLWMEARRKRLGAPRSYPVQMVPLAARKWGAPFDVSAGNNAVLWVEVFVPEKTPAGSYRGKLSLAGRELELRLRVWNFTLPGVSHFPCWVYVGPEEIAYSFHRRSGDIKEMMPTFDSYFQLAHNHRVCLMENIEYGRKYMQSPDRRFLDYYTGKAFKGPFGAGYGYELLPLGNDHLEDMARLCSSRGWLNRAFIYLYDEPGSKAAYEKVLALGRAARAATGGAIMRMVTEQYQPSKPDWPSLDPEVDIFCSNGIPPRSVRQVGDKGNAVWTYNSGHAGAMYTDAPGPAARTHAWAGFITGSRAWYFWDGVYVVDRHNRWKRQRRQVKRNPAKYLTDVWRRALNFDEASKPWRKGKLYPAAWSLRLNGDGLLFYPGFDVGLQQAVGCFRLKNLRRGSQDFEYLYLLEKAGKRQAALAVARGLFKSSESAKTSRDGQAGPRRLQYSKDPAAWDRARLELGKMLDRIGEQALRAKLTPYNQYPNPVGHKAFYGGRRY